MKLVAAAVLSAALVYFGVWVRSEFFTEAPFAPLYGPGYDELEQVAEKMVRPGDTLHITATKCAHEQVDVEGQSTWRRVSPTVLRVSGKSGSLTFQAGCETSRFAVVVPDLPPGIWERTGTETAFKGTKQQKQVWTTVRFEVAPPAEQP